MTEILTDDDRAALFAENTPVTNFVANITDFYFENYGQDSFGRRCSPCHDALDTDGTFSAKLLATLGVRDSVA